jgi:hypothetical protein
LSPNYKTELATLEDVKIASIVWGATLIMCLMTVWKAVEQTQSILYRGKVARSFYVWIVWVYLINNFALSIVCWMFMAASIAPRYVKLLTPHSNANDVLVLSSSSSCVSSC